MLSVVPFRDEGIAPPRRMVNMLLCSVYVSSSSNVSMIRVLLVKYVLFNSGSRKFRAQLAVNVIVVSCPSLVIF